MKRIIGIVKLYKMDTSELFADLGMNHLHSFGVIHDDYQSKSAKVSHGGTGYSSGKVVTQHVSLKDSMTGSVSVIQGMRGLVDAITIQSQESQMVIGDTIRSTRSSKHRHHSSSNSSSNSLGGDGDSQVDTFLIDCIFFILNQFVGISITPEEFLGNLNFYESVIDIMLTLPQPSIHISSIPPALMHLPAKLQFNKLELYTDHNEALVIDKLKRLINRRNDHLLALSLSAEERGHDFHHHPVTSQYSTTSSSSSSSSANDIKKRLSWNSKDDIVVATKSIKISSDGLSFSKISSVATASTTAKANAGVDGISANTTSGMVLTRSMRCSINQIQVSNPVNDDDTTCSSGRGNTKAHSSTVKKVERNDKSDTIEKEEDDSEEDESKVIMPEDMFTAHLYINEMRTVSHLSATWYKKVLSELASMRESLPHNVTIFSGINCSQPCLMKMLMFPESIDSPYCGACFEFDAYIPHEYPNVPPKVLLVTTGGGSVRFNPNLYNCGKVCLSLLGR